MIPITGGHKGPLPAQPHSRPYGTMAPKGWAARLLELEEMTSQPADAAQGGEEFQDADI